MKQKHYVDIERFKAKYDEAISVGDLIHVSEKIDGANASFTYDPETGTVKAFSRKNELSADNTLRGFYNYVQSMPLDFVKRVVTNNGKWVIFGEWLVPHSVKYPDEAYHHFYIYDIWDTENEIWCDQNFVNLMCSIFKLYSVDVRQPECFYYGKFNGWEELYKLVGKTAIGATPCGEGIVIKNQSVLDQKNRRLPTYIKIVSEKFAEVHKNKSKTVDPEVLKQREASRQLAATIVTEQRVQKFLNKFVDEGILPEDWDERNFGTIAKTLPREIYNDCVKEEPETTNQIEDFGKICGKLTMELVRSLIK